MKTRSKRQLRLQQEKEEEESGNLTLIQVMGLDPVTIAAATVDPNHRNFLDLLSPVLESISNCLLDIPDLSSFTVVCRVSRSLAATSATTVPLVSRPPLLRSFATTPYQQKTFKNLPHQRKCKIQSVVSTKSGVAKERRKGQRKTRGMTVVDMAVRDRDTQQMTTKEERLGTSSKRFEIDSRTRHGRSSKFQWSGVYRGGDNPGSRPTT